MSEKPLRFGLIGFGAWGQFHADSIARTEGAALAAISAKSDETCARAREAYPGAAVYSNYRDMLESEELDIVDIVLPSYLHHRIAKPVLESGRHLLLEKPMTLTLEHCRDLVQRAEARGCVLAVGHELRLASLWGEVKRQIDAGTIGDPQYVLVELSRGPYRTGAEGWRYDLERVGSWILEEPIHFFDLARWYLSSAGDPQRICAAASSKQDRPELKDNFSCILEMSNGAYAVISQTLSAFEHHQTVKVSGTKGAIWASWSGAKDRTLEPAHFLKVFDGNTVEEKPLKAMSGEVFELRAEIAMMVDCVRGNKQPIATGHDGMWSVGMCLAAERSVETGRPVQFSDVMG